ncbi:MAG: hypothetical protein CMI60_21575 [Parvibaculum sp.]|nr:hypothetical protein [Parvibaculum sp.]
MALAIGNKTAAVATPTWPSTSLTRAHTQNTGADGFLFVSFIMSNTRSYSGCEYGGQAMTLIKAQNFGGLAQRWACYGLLNPPTGNNDIIVSFSGAVNNPVSMFAVSFTGSSGAGNFATIGALTTPNSQTLLVSAGSCIYATGISNNAFTGIDIDGSARTLEFQHNTNKQISGALSAVPLSAGTIDVVTKVTFNTVSNSRVEIKEAGTPPSTDNGNFLLMF